MTGNKVFPIRTIGLVILMFTVMPSPADEEAKSLVNTYRSIAGVPPVTFDAGLDANCFAHSRYMAENNHLTHDQNPALPFASPEGDAAGGNGNVWLGSATATPFWQPTNPVHSWMASPGHRFWLLYPTTPTFGFGFYMAENNRAGATLDVLSHHAINQDPNYTGWPILYPAKDQTGVPSTAFPVSMMWRYFGETPVVNDTRFNIVGGDQVAHTTTTGVPAGHKGILLTPQSPLPDNTWFEVSVFGSHNSVPFAETWRFATGTPVTEPTPTPTPLNPLGEIRAILLAQSSPDLMFDLNDDMVLDAADLAIAPR